MGEEREHAQEGSHEHAEAQAGQQAQLAPELMGAIANVGDAAVRRMAEAAQHGTERLDVGLTGHTEGYGYENGLTEIYSTHHGQPGAAAKEILARHPKQPSIILNEISIKLATDRTKKGEAYRLWVVELVRALSSAGKQIVVCSALNSEPTVMQLFKHLGEIGGVRMGMETQVTGKDTPQSIHDKLEKTLHLMAKVGIGPREIVHVANLAHTDAGKGFGSSGASEKAFDANIKTEVAEAKKLHYSAVMGYGFTQTQKTIDAWNSAWSSTK